MDWRSLPPHPTNTAFTGLPYPSQSGRGPAHLQVAGGAHACRVVGATAPVDQVVGARVAGARVVRHLVVLEACGGRRAGGGHSFGGWAETGRACTEVDGWDALQIPSKQAVREGCRRQRGTRSSSSSSQAPRPDRRHVPCTPRSAHPRPAALPMPGSTWRPQPRRRAAAARLARSAAQRACGPPPAVRVGWAGGCSGWAGGWSGAAASKTKPRGVWSSTRGSAGARWRTPVAGQPARQGSRTGGGQLQAASISFRTPLLLDAPVPPPPSRHGISCQAARLPDPATLLRRACRSYVDTWCGPASSAASSDRSHSSSVSCMGAGTRTHLQ